MQRKYHHKKLFKQDSKKLPSYSKDSKKYKKQNSFSQRVLKFLLRWSFILSIWLVTIAFSLLLYYSHDLPELTKLKQPEPQRKITLIAANGEILASVGDLRGEYVNFERIPTHLVNAVLATEDRKFFAHSGIDLVGLLRAAYVNYKAGHIIQGGSTISQQLAKILFLSPERTVKRKIQELLLALYLEHKFSKKEIISIYLNKVYLGSGIFGVEAAAKYYFGKNLNDINLYEAALIAGLLKAPTRYSPTRHNALAAKRTLQILLSMKDAGYISEQEIKTADANPIILKTSEMGLFTHQYVANWLREEVNELSLDTTSDLVVRTTIDLTLQKIAEQTVERILSGTSKELHIGQGALVSMKPEGSILALVGGRNYDKSSFNRATQAERQPGSAFKIFVYAAAFQAGYTPASIVSDEPVALKKWRPKNYTRTYLGNITLRESFAKSVNTVSIKLSEQVGRSKIIELAHKMGISSTLKPHPSIALGTSEVNLLDLTGSISTICNDGYRVAPYAIVEIKNSAGEIIYSKRNRSKEHVLDYKVVGYMKDILRNAVETGTAKLGVLDKHKAWGKTGTTQQYRDAWFLGFSQDVVTGVWVGNDDNSPMNKVTGGSIPARIWHEYMSEALGEGTEGLNFKELQELYSEPEEPQGLWEELDQIL
jgi:penicillin-binding protein 1A